MTALRPWFLAAVLALLGIAFWRGWAMGAEHEKGRAAAAADCASFVEEAMPWIAPRSCRASEPDMPGKRPS